MADAVVDPGTVVVHLKDADAALSAMVRADRLPGLLVFALFAIFGHVALRDVGRLKAFGNSARVLERCSYVRSYCKRTKRVECCEIPNAPASKGNPLDELLLQIGRVVPVKDVKLVGAEAPKHDQNEGLYK